MIAIMVADAIRHAGLAHVNARREGDTGGCDDTAQKLVRKFESSNVRVFPEGVGPASCRPGSGTAAPPLGLHAAW